MFEKPLYRCAPDCDHHEYEPPDGSHEGSEDGDDY